MPSGRTIGARRRAPCWRTWRTGAVGPAPPGRLPRHGRGSSAQHRRSWTGLAGSRSDARTAPLSSRSGLGARLPGLLGCGAGLRAGHRGRSEVLPAGDLVLSASGFVRSPQIRQKSRICAVSTRSSGRTRPQTSGRIRRRHVIEPGDDRALACARLDAADRARREIVEQPWSAACAVRAGSRVAIAAAVEDDHRAVLEVVDPALGQRPVARTVEPRLDGPDARRVVVRARGGRAVGVRHLLAGVRRGGCPCPAGHSPGLAMRPGPGSRSGSASTPGCRRRPARRPRRTRTRRSTRSRRSPRAPRWASRYRSMNDGL